MRSWAKQWLTMTFVASVLLLAGGRGVRGQDFVVVDADDRRIVLNQKGVVTLVLVCSEDSEDLCRQVGRMMDPYHGTDRYRHRVVVDLRDSWGSMMESLVKSEMRDNMDEEAERLLPVYRAKKSSRHPRQDLSATPDLEGAIAKRLGFAEPKEELRAVLFGPDGKVIQRWDVVREPGVLVEAVGTALRSN